MTQTLSPTTDWEVACYNMSELYRKAVEENEQLKKFCRQYLDTMEGIFDNDKDFLSDEHKEEYIQCAEFIGRKYRIKEVKESML